ncbi:MAG: pantoate--beta-alanine ligase, partial [Rhodospirillaceae bacterium]|nr:pantoate--beta-alanine ligase [Rhodospirillaceae bacterium]
AAADRIAEGAAVDAELAAGRSALLAAGFADVDYLELRAADNLQALDRLDRPARLLAAAWLGQTRLIDNVPVMPKAA